MTLSVERNWADPLTLQVRFAFEFVTSMASEFDASSAKEKAETMRTIITVSKAKAIALAKAKDGVTAIEYGLIAGFIALTIIAGIQLFGTNLAAFFNGMAATVGALPTGG
jgi:pilus assembly protein Flp/PilA